MLLRWFSACKLGSGICQIRCCPCCEWWILWIVFSLLRMESSAFVSQLRKCQHIWPRRWIVSCIVIFSFSIPTTIRQFLLVFSLNMPVLCFTGMLRKGAFMTNDTNVFLIRKCLHISRILEEFSSLFLMVRFPVDTRSSWNFCSIQRAIFCVDIKYFVVWSMCFWWASTLVMLMGK